jgi:hypothetical protein
MSLVDESLGFGAYGPPREVELELGGHGGWEMEMYVS